MNFAVSKILLIKFKIPHDSNFLAVDILCKGNGLPGDFFPIFKRKIEIYFLNPNPAEPLYILPLQTM